MGDSIDCGIMIQLRREDCPSRNFFWLKHEHLKRIQHLFPKPRGVARVDDRHVLSGIIHVIRNGLRWRDAPADNGAHNTLYNRWARWSHMGIFARILTELTFEGGKTDTLMIDATRLKAHRTASSMRLNKRVWSPDWPHEGRIELQTARHR